MLYRYFIHILLLHMFIPIRSMYGIYANIWGILMGSMLPYIAAPWILWDMHTYTTSVTYQYHCHHFRTTVPPLPRRHRPLSSRNCIGSTAQMVADLATDFSTQKKIWGWVKSLVPCREPQVIAGIYGCSSH